MDLLDADEFERVFSVNLIGNYQMCRAAAPHLKASGDAAIVNISSIGAMRGSGSSIAYSASKGALNTLTLSMARLLAPEVRVNALVSGRPPRQLDEEDHERRGVREADRADRDGVSAQARHLAGDVARAALFLVEGATTMTGECLRMDCGQHLGDQGARI